MVRFHKKNSNGSFMEQKVSFLIEQAQESLGSCDKLSSAKLFNLDGAMKNATYAHNEYNVCLLLKKSTKLQELDLNCPHVMLNKKH